MSLKVGRNEKCPCGSGKKFKKCCRNYVVEHMKNKEKDQQIGYKDHVAVAGHVYNHLLEMDTQNNIFNWAKCIYRNGRVIAAENIQPYTLVEIHPIHFLVKDDEFYPCTKLVGTEGITSPIALDTNSKFTDYIDETVQIASSKEIQLENQCGHLLPESDTGSVVRYHFGMYALFYISNRFVQMGETIEWTAREWRPVVERYIKGHRETMKNFNEHYTQSVNHFTHIQSASKNWSEEEAVAMQNIFDKINKVNSN
jgi:hypothetical protein